MHLSIQLRLSRPEQLRPFNSNDLPRSYRDAFPPAITAIPIPFFFAYSPSLSFISIYIHLVEESVSCFLLTNLKVDWIR